MTFKNSWCLGLIVLTVLIYMGCEKIPTEVITTTPQNKIALANITALDGSSLTGTANFIEIRDMLQVAIEIHNATPGLHAAHLHIGKDCSDVGPHWHPMDISAGTAGISVADATLDIPPIGVGEIGNIYVNKNGSGVLEFTTPFWTIGGDPSTNILDKLILIHETGDTFQINPHNGNTGTHTQIQGETVDVIPQDTHNCTLAVLAQHIDLQSVDHHLPGQDFSPHSHNLLELLLNCFLSPEQLVDPSILITIPFEGTVAYKSFLNIQHKTLGTYHAFFIDQGLPVDSDFFMNQFKQIILSGSPEDLEEEMKNRLRHFYIISGVDLEKPNVTMEFNVLMTNFLDDRTTAWVLGYFQGDDVAFREWIFSTVKAFGVRPGAGSRIGCGVIELVE
ncbi:superoxide dismutase family protein [Candidatus Poribacteria bacterium]|nr:superoxide dismutase family protein [Candidatus Poribacteria bacterium]